MGPQADLRIGVQVDPRLHSRNIVNDHPFTPDEVKYLQDGGMQSVIADNAGRFAQSEPQPVRTRPASQPRQHKAFLRLGRRLTIGTDAGGWCRYRRAAAASQCHAAQAALQFG